MVPTNSHRPSMRFRQFIGRPARELQLVDARSRRVCSVCEKLQFAIAAIGRWWLYRQISLEDLGVRDRFGSGSGTAWWCVGNRSWGFQTDLSTFLEIPNNEYYEYYGPDYELDVRTSNMTDHNTPEYLAKIRQSVFEGLRGKTAAPGVQIQRTLLP